jgi:hypothetical protein
MAEQADRQALLSVARLVASLLGEFSRAFYIPGETPLLEQVRK